MDYGPVVTAAAKQNILGLVQSGIDQGAKLVVDGRDFSLQGYEDGFFVGAHLFDNVTPDMDIYKKKSLALSYPQSARAAMKRRLALPWITNMATALQSLPRWRYRT